MTATLALYEPKEFGYKHPALIGTANVAQSVEHQVVVLGVAGSIPVIRPTFRV